MPTTATNNPTSRRRHRRRVHPLRRDLVASAVAVALALLLVIAPLGHRRSSLLVVSVLAMLGIAAFSLLALTSFESFVLALIVIRPVADIPKTALHASTRSGLVASGLGVMFIVAAVAWLAVQRPPPARLRSPSHALAAYLLLTAAALSVAASAQIGASLAEFARMAAGVGMLVVLLRIVVDAPTSQRVLAACYVSSVVPLALGVWQAATGSAYAGASSIQRVTGPFTHPNSFALYLAMLIVMSVALFPYVSSRVRAGLVLHISVSAVVLLTTYSRGGWLAVLAGLAIVGALQAPKLLLTLPVIVVGALLAVPSTGSRLSDLSRTTTAFGTPANSAVWRVDNWSAAISENERPLTGIGLGMSETASAINALPHDDFVRAYVETGFVGLAAYVCFLGSLAILARAAVRRARGGYTRGVAVGFAGVLTAFVVASTYSNLWTQVVVLWLFFPFAAAGTAAAAAVDDREIDLTSLR